MILGVQSHYLHNSKKIDSGVEQTGYENETQKKNP